MARIASATPESGSRTHTATERPGWPSSAKDSKAATSRAANARRWASVVASFALVARAHAGAVGSERPTRCQFAGIPLSKSVITRLRVSLSNIGHAVEGLAAEHRARTRRLNGSPCSTAVHGQRPVPQAANRLTPDEMAGLLSAERTDGLLRGAGPSRSDGTDDQPPDGRDRPERENDRRCDHEVARPVEGWVAWQHPSRELERHDGLPEDE